MLILMWIKKLFLDSVMFYSDDPNGGGGGGEPEIAWPEGLDDGLKEHKQLLNFYDKENKSWNVGGLMKSFVHTKAMVGADKLPKPKDDWTDEQWFDFNKSIGLPESLDKYTVEASKDNLDEGFFNKFKEIAYQAGIRPTQAQKLISWYDEAAKSQMDEARERYQSQITKGNSKLMAEYGDALKGKLEKMDFAIDMMVTEDTKNALKEKGMLDDPSFRKLMIEVADSMGEDKFPETIVTGGGLTPEAADEQIKELYGSLKTARGQYKAELLDKISKLSAIKNGKSNRRMSGRTAIM